MVEGTFVKIKELYFFRTARAALLSVFPFVLIGSLAKTALMTLLEPDGFLSGMLGVQASGNAAGLAGGIHALTCGLSGLLAAHYAAGYAAQFAGRSYNTAAAAGFISYLALCFQRAGSTHGFVFAYRMLGMQGLLIGIVFGYVVGRLFTVSGDLFAEIEGRDEAGRLPAGSFRMILPLVLSLAFATVLNLIGGTLFKGGVYQGMKASSENFPETLWLGLLTSLGTWCGLFGPYTGSIFTDDAVSTRNLNYALAHGGSLVHVPYRLTTYSTWFAYAQLAGLGLLLALMFVSNRRNRRLLCWWCLLPVFFGYDAALDIGAPVILNPLLLVPYVLVPQLNMAVVSAFYRSGILLPAVYPVADGTPPLLRAFLATNGSPGALVCAVFLTALDAMLFAVCIRFAERRISRLKGGVVDEE